MVSLYGGTFDLSSVRVLYYGHFQPDRGHFRKFLGQPQFGLHGCFLNEYHRILAAISSFPVLPEWVRYFGWNRFGISCTNPKEFGHVYGRVRKYIYYRDRAARDICEAFRPYYRYRH